jgi:hypothetical protein
MMAAAVEGTIMDLMVCVVKDEQVNITFQAAAAGNDDNGNDDPEEVADRHYPSKYATIWRSIIEEKKPRRSSLLRYTH